MAVVADKVVVELEAKLDRYKSNVIDAEKVFSKSMDGTSKASKRASASIARDADLLGEKLRREYQDMGRNLGQGFQTGSRAAQVALAGITIYAIKLAKDAGEIESAFDVAFKGAAKGARDFSEVLAGKVGRDAVETRQAMTRLQLVLTGTGVAAAQATELTKALATSGIDAGSLFNTSDAEAFQKIISGITGESEPLKAFGVVLTETKTKAELLRLGFKGNAEQASEAAKSIARANLILKGLSVAQGDAARTADSAANKQRALTAEFNKAARELGQELLPAFIAVAGAATDVLKAFNEMPGGLQVASLGILAFVAASGPLAGLLAGLGKVIKLAQATRAALAGVAAASGATGALGAAGAAIGGAGAATLGGIGAAGTALVGGAVTLGYEGMNQGRLQKVLGDIRKAEDRELAAALKYLQGLPQGRVNNTFTQGRIRGEIAARANAKSGATSTDPVAAFTLPDALKVGGGSGAKTRKAGSASIDLRTGTIEVDQSTVVDLINRLSGPALSADSNPSDFSPAGDAVQQASDDLLSYQDEVYQSTYNSIANGLEAGFRDGLPGVLQFFSQELQRSLISGLAKSLTDLISQTGPGGKGGTIVTAAAAIFGRASGGNMVGGRPYLVNEGRPEVFVPPMSGQMVPLSRIGGGRTTINPQVKMTVDLTGANGDDTIVRIARQAAIQAGRQAYAQAMRDAPAAVAKRQGERG